MRLQKYMAACGVASRRKSEEMIAQGRVKVNGEVITTPGLKVDPELDSIEVSGRRIYLEKKYYFLFNKPSNVLCTAGDSRERTTVIDFFKDIDVRLFTVGRLDYITSGLIIVTNDGEFTNFITHPKNEKEKEYTVRINGYLSDANIKTLSNSMNIDNYMTSPAKVSLISRSKVSSAFNITIHEGRNRQIRKMIETLDHRIVFLQRIRISNLKINDLKEGTYRPLTQSEISLLKE